MIPEKMHVLENKTLKITNALIHEVPLDATFDIQRVVYMMQSYIKAKSFQMRGPLITSTSLTKNPQGARPTLSTKVILQLTEPVQSCEQPYTFEPVIRVSPCLFVRFTGAMRDMQYAGVKLNLYAYENEIQLEGSSYTVFVNKCEQSVTADMFMPINKDEG